MCGCGVGEGKSITFKPRKELASQGLWKGFSRQMEQPAKSTRDSKEQDVLEERSPGRWSWSLVRGKTK